MLGKSSALHPNPSANIYLQRYAWPGPLIKVLPCHDTGIIVVIPCYSEDKILESLKCLSDCQPPVCHVEVIVVVNFGNHENHDIKSFNHQTADEIERFAVSHNPDRITFHVIRAFDLPEKHAGVGLARKIGMDEAVRRFVLNKNRDGIIVCFDADCLCSSNYLLEIEHFYRNNKMVHCALLAFEHNLSIIGDVRNREAIINYELHLRYYIQALKYSHFPYAYQTIGSCITLRSSIYQKQGGMNLRKAGEDFYFLQKLFPLGGVQNLTTATVYPSARPSHRVPFGTGRSILELLEAQQADEYFTYHPETFMELKQFCEAVPILWNRDVKVFLNMQGTAMRDYLNTIKFFEKIEKIHRNVASEAQFVSSFFAWFNGFQVLKYVHFARDHYYGKMEIMKACSWVFGKQLDLPVPDNKESMLLLMRNLDHLE